MLKKRFNVMLTHWQVSLLDEYAKKQGYSRSELINILIREYIEKQERNVTK